MFNCNTLRSIATSLLSIATRYSSIGGALVRFSFDLICFLSPSSLLELLGYNQLNLLAPFLLVVYYRNSLALSPSLDDLQIITAFTSCPQTILPPGAPIASSRRDLEGGVIVMGHPFRRPRNLPQSPRHSPNPFDVSSNPLICLRMLRRLFETSIPL